MIAELTWHSNATPCGQERTTNVAFDSAGLRKGETTAALPGRLTLRSSRRRAVCWPGASAPRFSATLRVARPGGGGTARLSERTLARLAKTTLSTGRWKYGRMHRVSE